MSIRPVAACRFRVRRLVGVSGHVQRIAITGGIACGKSVVGTVCNGLGIHVCEADELAHAIMRKGTPVYDAIVNRFGPGILYAEGEIDRRRLGAQVFANERARMELNAIVHPAVKQAWEAWLGERDGAAAVIVALLFEAGMESGWNAVVCVTASSAFQRARLAERGLGPVEIERRLESQMPVAEKVERADYVIVNHGTVDLLKEQTEKVLEQILER